MKQYRRNTVIMCAGRFITGHPFTVSYLVLYDVTEINTQSYYTLIRVSKTSVQRTQVQVRGGQWNVGGHSMNWRDVELSK